MGLLLKIKRRMRTTRTTRKRRGEFFFLRAIFIY